MIATDDLEQITVDLAQQFWQGVKLIASYESEVYLSGLGT